MNPPEPEPPALSETAIIHLYRGELARMTAYRVRLDTTTNWAIGTNAAIISLGLGGRDTPHLLFAVAVILNLAFLAMEARRFRGFELIRQRVRLLETGFFAPALGSAPNPDWQRQMADSLTTPTPPVSYLQATSVRLRRNFLPLILLDYAAWLFKLQRGRGIPDEAAAFGQSGPLVLAIAGVLLAALVALALRHASPEEG